MFCSIYLLRIVVFRTIISSKGLDGHLLRLPPQSVVVFTDENNISSAETSTGNNNSKLGSNLTGLIIIVLIMKVVL